MIRHNYFSILVWITLFSFLFVGCQKTSPDPELGNNEKLQTILDQILTKYNGKGVSASIIYNEQDSWSGASGISF
jgi:hypothetical protein